MAIRGPLGLYRSNMLDALARWARSIKRDAHALYLAARDPRVPWYAKAMGMFVAAYALSPIDLIPDFIPVLGYIDDAVILPLGIWVAVKLIPSEVMVEHRRAAELAADRPVSRTAALVIAALWAVSSVAVMWIGLWLLG
jgi:uncharacterized membrane protein YkvA (DUF1232 family)